MSRKKADELGIKPLVTIKGNASAGVDPSIMGIGPVQAVKKALEKASVSMEELELIEANEAFAAQSLAVDRELAFNKDILNVNGGAIALGHPIDGKIEDSKINFVEVVGNEGLERAYVIKKESGRYFLKVGDYETARGLSGNEKGVQLLK